jgi:hypothetical protein
MAARTVPPTYVLQGQRAGIGRSVLAVVAAVLVLIASWALVIGGVVLVARALS